LQEGQHIVRDSKTSYHERYTDGERQGQQKPRLLGIIRTSSPTTSSSGYANTPEKQDSDLKYHLIRMIEDFKKGINNSLKEIQENTDKQVETLKEETQKSLKELQKNTTKQVKELNKTI
jgi:gas vesicle protein